MRLVNNLIKDVQSHRNDPLMQSGVFSGQSQFARVYPGKITCKLGFNFVSPVCPQSHILKQCFSRTVK